MIGVCRASSSRKQSWPYGASITCSSTGLPSPRRAASISCDAHGGYSQSELKAISSVRAEIPSSARASDPSAVLPREIEIGQRPRRVDVRVGVEPLDERVGLVAEVALDLELRLGDRVANVVGELKSPAELVTQSLRRQIRDVADHSRHAHARARRVFGVVVVTPLPRRVAHDRVPGDRIPGHALRVQRVRAGDRHDRIDLVGVADRPLERLHSPERATGHRCEPLDPELVQERALGPDHVRDGDHREVGAIRPARGRIERRGSRGAAAPAEQVRGDDEVLVGVEGLAGADHPVPPAEALAGGAVAIVGPEAVPGALLRGRLREAGCVRVAAERVADHDHIVASG